MLCHHKRGILGEREGNRLSEILEKLRSIKAAPHRKKQYLFFKQALVKYCQPDPKAPRPQPYQKPTVVKPIGCEIPHFHPLFPYCSPAEDEYTDNALSPSPPGVFQSWKHIY